MSTQLPGVFAPVLASLQARLAETTPGVSAVVPVRWWDRRFSYLLEAQVVDDGRVRTAFVKIVRPRSEAGRQAALERLARDASTTAALQDRLPGGLAAVETIAWFPEHLAIVTAGAPGEPLLRRIEREARWKGVAPQRLVDVLARVGSWLSAFQTALPAEGQETVDRLIEYVDVRLVKLRNGWLGFTEADRARVLRWLEASAGRLSASDLALTTVHADFAPSNILVSDDRVTVLDFTMTRTGLRWHDLAHLWVHLDLLKAKPWFRAPVVAGLQSALVSGYDPRLQPDAPAFLICRLVNQVNHFAALVVRGSPWTTWPYDWYQQRRHLAGLRRLVMAA